MIHSTDTDTLLTALIKNTVYSLKRREIYQ
jgi:hypothetical protein